MALRTVVVAQPEHPGSQQSTYPAQAGAGPRAVALSEVGTVFKRVLSNGRPKRELFRTGVRATRPKCVFSRGGDATRILPVVAHGRTLTWPPSTPISPKPRSAQAWPAAGFFQALVENSPDTIFLINLETEECMYVSPAVRSLLGRDPEAIIGRPLTDFVHPDDASELLARSASRREGRGVLAAVTRMSHGERTWVWVQATASPMVELEARTTAVFTVTGASERVRAELGLRNARVRLRRAARPSSEEETETGSCVRRTTATTSSSKRSPARSSSATTRPASTHGASPTSRSHSRARSTPSSQRHPTFGTASCCTTSARSAFRTRFSLKPGPLTERETRILQMHTTLGEHLLAFVPFVSDLVHDVVAYHHERWDEFRLPVGTQRQGRSRSLLESSRSPTHSMRLRTTGRTARPVP